MSNLRSRREVLKLLALAGFSVYLPGCLNPDTPPPPPAPTIPPTDSSIADTVAELEKAMVSNNVTYVYKADEAYEKLRLGYNLQVQKSPAIIALCKNTEGVAEAIQLAQQEGLKVAVKSGGHSFEAFSSIDDGLQINLSLLNNISWLENNQVAIEPACLLKDIYDALLPKKRLVPAGSCGTVGMGGLTLGGGYGFFARKYGLTCDNMVEATLVDGQGQIHTTQTGDDLMWALKGGGNGNMGVVTNMVFNTHRAPATFTRHRFKAYKLDKERTKELLQNYFEFSARLPATCFAAFVLNYKTMVLLITNYGKDNAPLTAMIERFAEISDKADIGTPKNLAKSLRNYYGIDHPLPFKNASAGYYDDYATIASSIDGVLDIVFRKHGLIFQINTLGGNIDNAEFEANSCYPHRKVPYLSELQAYWEEGKDPTHLIDSFNEIQNLLYDNGIRRQYRNYPHMGFKDWETAYYGADNYSRLQDIKQQYDPNDLFSNGQTVRLKA